MRLNSLLIFSENNIDLMRAGPSESFSASLDIVSDTNSREAFKRAHDWLQDCVNSHRHIRKNIDYNYIPLRVLDVGLLLGNALGFDQSPERHRRNRSSYGDARLLKVRLIEAKQTFKEPIQYAALSYCWGDDLESVITTTRENYHAHKFEIPLDTLPKTVQDAITVCRRLGIQYLWVDSLCIIQNDNQDWRRQSAQMRYVYSNSHVTLAAHNASSCKQGFLGRQLCGYPDWQRPITSSTPSESKYFIRMMVKPGWFGKPTWSYSVPGITHAKVEPTSLMKRGWTLQECILPERVLHFTGWEMVWECSARHFCECGHVTAFEKHPGTAMLKTRLGRYPLMADNSKGWADLVQEYTQRELSVRTDKLVALSGLALSLENANTPLKSIYLAGLIRTHLARQLLWYVDDSIILACPRPSPYRAPTWSWASVDTPIKYDWQRSFRSHVVIHDDSTFCVPSDDFHPTGSVTDGEMVIEGLLAPVQLVTAERSARNTSDNLIVTSSIVRARSGFRFDITSDVQMGIDMRRGDPGFDCWVEGNCPLSSWEMAGMQCGKCHFELESNPKIWCLKVATQEEYGNEWVSFLVLQRANPIKGLAWERVGMGKIQTARGFETLCSDSTLFDGARTERIRVL